MSNGDGDPGRTKMITRRLFIAVLALWALAPIVANAQVRGGTIRIGMDADNTTMDPHRSTAAGDRQVYNNLYGKLVDIDTRFGIVPQLAQSWDIKNGGATHPLTPLPRGHVSPRPAPKAQHV